jgi:hypothetical protein
MWLPMSNLLPNFITPPKPILGSLQMKTMIHLKENTTLGCQELFLLENHAMNEKADHPRLEMLMGFLLVEEMYLQAMMVADLLAMVVIGL